jgi:uncharacterized protein (DUF697 family)/GTP-binding protein EngB required for normal cell division
MQPQQRLEEMADLLGKFFVLLPEPPRGSVMREFQKLREIIMESRPPKFLILGRRGAGKSSLINAIFGEKVATVGSVTSETGKGVWYSFQEERGAIRVLDTRGLGDATKPESANFQDALDEIKSSIDDECPDAILFLCKAKEVDSRISEDSANVSEIQAYIFETHQYKAPVVALVTQVDELDPASVSVPPFDNDAKQANIAKAVAALMNAHLRARIELVQVLPVCAYAEYENSRIIYDRRWNIDALIGYLLEVLPNSAQLELARLSRIRTVQVKMARKVIATATAICTAVGATPIPIADLPVITSLQIGMITAIGYISGRELSHKTVKEFLAALGLNIGAGFVFREAARALIKFVFPGAGGAISGVVAFAATWGLGEAAIAYFIEGKPIEEARKKLDEGKRKQLGK